MIAVGGCLFSWRYLELFFMNVMWMQWIPIVAAFFKKYISHVHKPNIYLFCQQAYKDSYCKILFCNKI